MVVRGLSANREMSLCHANLLRSKNPKQLFDSPSLASIASPWVFRINFLYVVFSENALEGDKWKL